VPSRTTTVVITVLFGLFGLIPSYVHGKRAERLGGSAGRYWTAFGVSFAASVLVYLGLIFALFAAVVNIGLRGNDGAAVSPPGAGDCGPTGRAAASAARRRCR
jgi:hypothetical protein